MPEPSVPPRQTTVDPLPPVPSSIEPMEQRAGSLVDDGLEPWERCGCAACQATIHALYGDHSDA